MSNCDLSVKIELQIAYEMLDLGYPLCVGNGLICYVERHSLLAKFFITFLKCTINKAERASASITMDASYCPHHVISVKVDSQIECKIPDLGNSISMGKGVIWCKERYPLLLKCSIIFLRCIRNDEIPTDSIVEPFRCGSYPVISTVVNSQIAYKIPDLG